MKFLVFQSKRLSYGSSWCFMEQMQKCLCRLGHQVTVFELEENLETQEKQLLQLCLAEFDGIFDVNSLLPSVQVDEEYYLNLFDAPFYHLIVDHPMHVHFSLCRPLRNHIVLCIDRGHQTYIKRYYPHIKAVYFMPFAGISTRQPVIPMQKRPYGILFPGTYTPLDYYRQQMDSQGEYYCELADAILEEYRRGSRKTIDELYRDLSDSDGSFFALKMYKACFVDRYIREWYRERVLQSLLRQKITVDVVGFRWEMYQSEGKEYLRIHKPCSYIQQLAMLGQSKMVLNVQPLFQDGAHDRVFNAMINHSVAVTDSCTFLQENFTAERDLFVYDKNAPEKMVDWVQSRLGQNALLEDMASQGYDKTSQKHTWEQRVQVLLEQIPKTRKS